MPENVNENVNENVGTTQTTVNQTEVSNESVNVPETKSKETQQNNSLKVPMENKTSNSIADFDYSVYEKEFIETGDISQKSREDLYKIFPKNLVDNYINNLALATTYNIAQTEQKAYAIVGGEENYQELMKWASANLDSNEKQAFNEIVESNNEYLAIQTIKGLQARMELEKVQGKSKRPNPIMGSNGSIHSQNSDVFLSRQDYANALNDPKYQTSPQYRAEVDNKLARTLQSGGYRA